MDKEVKYLNFVIRILYFLHSLPLYSLANCNQAVATGVDVEVAEGLPSFLHQLGQLPILVGDVDGIAHHHAQGHHGDHINGDVDEHAG